MNSIVKYGKSNPDRFVYGYFDLFDTLKDSNKYSDLN